MTEENEVLLLLKELVNRVQQLESVAYNKDNVLMKSGFVVVNTPTPSIDNSNASGSEVDRIAKMDWEDIGKMVSKLEGGY